MFGPKVQRRENVGGSLKTLGPQMLGIWSIGLFPFDESKCNTQKPICQVFCQKNFLVYIFMLCFIGIQTMDTRLN